MKKSISLVGLSLFLISCSQSTTFERRDSNLEDSSKDSEISCPERINGTVAVLPKSILDAKEAHQDRVVAERAIRLTNAIDRKSDLTAISHDHILVRKPVDQDQAEAQQTIYDYYVEVRTDERIHHVALELIKKGVDLRKLSRSEIERRVNVIEAQVRMEAYQTLHSISKLSVRFTDFKDTMTEVVRLKYDNGNPVYPSDVRSQLARGLVACQLYQ